MNFITTGFKDDRMGLEVEDSGLQGTEIVAHAKKDSLGNWTNPHLLSEHLRSTGDLAYDFSEKFHSGEFGKTLGILHDLGKGRKEWQRYFRKKSGYGDSQPPEDHVSTVQHAIYGAKYAMEKLPVFGEILSYSIAGHHSGLPDWSSEDGGQASLKYKLNSDIDLKSIDRSIIQNLETLEIDKIPWKFGRGLDLSLWIRMLFSSLVDADFLDTESYMNPENTVLRRNNIDFSKLLNNFNEYMDKKEETAEDTQVNQIRKKVREKCVELASEPMGVFSLTVPTGGGKTLSSLAFALNHAVKHNLDRVIYVIPYTSIIEQNADVFRSALGEESVVEHHSNISDEKETEQTRLASENWDAPVIVTTSVQFFESLFASKPSRCRKLHNIVNSVVVLDEAQMLPVNYLEPILKTLKLLVEKYRVSIVLSTATQPALKEHTVGGVDFPGFENITEIMGNGVSELYDSLNRVKLYMPEDLTSPKPWEELSGELLQYPQVLCIVSDRKSCRELHSLMPEGTFHLSALMCGAHRSVKIKEIKQKLENDEPVRVVSTQLVEAGVDIDFPVVYRAMAGLDSIAQAAGRCNREGKNSEQGKVVVFKSPRSVPAGILRKAENTLKLIISEIEPNYLEPASFERFFTELYWKANNLDSEKISELLSNYLNISFKTASSKFKLIDDTIQKTILVRYDGESEKLIQNLIKYGKSRSLMRKMQRYAVNIYNREFDSLLEKGLIEEVQDGLYALTSNLSYNDDIGLIIDKVLYEPEKYIIQ